MAKRKSDRDLIWLGAGIVGLYLLNPLPALAVIPPTPPRPPTPKPPMLPPVPPPPDDSPPPMGESEDAVLSSTIVHYGPGKRNVNSIDGYRRAIDSELQKAPTLMSEIWGHLKNPIGTVVFRAYDGRDWALAVETHNNHPELGPTNKGVSVFVKDETVVDDTTGLDEGTQNNLQLLVFAGIALMSYKLLA